MKKTLTKKQLKKTSGGTGVGDKIIAESTAYGRKLVDDAFARGTLAEERYIIHALTVATLLVKTIEHKIAIPESIVTSDGAKAKIWPI